MSDRMAIVAGGTGLVGNLLVDELLARADWTKVLMVGRRRSGRDHPKLEEQVVDFAALGGQALPRAEAAFCCLGTTLKKAGSQRAFRAVDLDAVVSFAQAAKAGGTERFFVVTATGADARSRIFYNRVKGEAEEALKAVGFALLGIARPSLLLGDRAESRPGERVAVVLSRALRPLLAPLAARSIEAHTVARALLGMAGNPAPGVRIYTNAELHQLGT